jgi:hypothetical protein
MRRLVNFPMARRTKARLAICSSQAARFSGAIAVAAIIQSGIVELHHRPL